MHDFILFVAATGFGGLAWLMLVVADWLLRDEEPGSRVRRRTSRAVSRPRQPVELAYQY